MKSKGNAICSKQKGGKNADDGTGRGTPPTKGPKPNKKDQKKKGK